MRRNKEEYYYENFEKFHKNKIIPKGKRNLKQLIVSESEALTVDEPPTFKDAGLEALHECGYVDSLVEVIRSGKEAIVYLGKNANGYVAIKIYADKEACLFKKKNAYSEDRVIVNKRFQKAVSQKSRIGRRVSHALWIQEEFKQMTYLYENGVAVPKPVCQVGRVVAMELIGNNGLPAPRISDLRLCKEEMMMAFEQSAYNLSMMLKLGRVHCDYSAYNILWWNKKAIVIDFPQVVELDRISNPSYFVNKDIETLCSSFRKNGFEVDFNKVKTKVLKLAKLDMF